MNLMLVNHSAQTSEPVSVAYAGFNPASVYSAGSGVLANAAHPGLVSTEIYHHDGPRRAAGTFWGIAVRLFAQGTERGSLPSLYAAVADVPGNSFAGPDHLRHMRGTPELIGRPATAEDSEAARRLEVSVGRRRDQADRRRHIVALSADGDTALEQAQTRLAAVEDEIFHALSLEERATLRELLLRAADGHPAECDAGTSRELPGP